MSDIIEITPVLEKTEIEYQGKKFDCRNCQGIGQCCGTVDIHNNKAACFKCKCQSLYDSTNRTKEGAERTSSVINNSTCKNCDNSTFTEDFCKINSYLENNLDSEYVDCSNTLLVTGEYNTLTDIEQKTSCNVDNQQAGSVNTYNPPPPPPPSSGFKISGGGISITLIYAIILFILIILKF